jgi:hypothetical protein
MKPVELIDKQLAYYNAHDLEGFVSTYAEDVKIYHLLDNKVILEGRDALREAYKERFLVLKVHATIDNRISIGNKVIDHESVTGLKKDEIVHAVAVYEVLHDLIKNVWFIYE